MFGSLLSFWKGKDFLIQVFDEFKTMLNNTKEMFEAVNSKLINNEDVPGLKEKVYRLDKDVNRAEREIRRKIAQHLLLQPTVDATACLLLMSVVKDAERLGDYCKNLFEVTELLEKPLDKKIFADWFGTMDEDLAALFRNTRKAFVESNEDRALTTFDVESKIVKKCDAIIEKLAKSDLTVNRAVCYTLIARHYKRVASHLANIASAVVMPVTEIDYFDEKKMKDE